MLIRLALLLIAFASPGNQDARAAGTAAGTTAVTDAFPAYSRQCGFPIVFAPTLSISQAVLDNRGRPVIVLDPSLGASEETDRRIFLIAHECAHHRMGHSRAASVAERLLSPGLVRDQELSADCWAAEHLARHGFDRAVQLVALRFHRSGLYSPGHGYPAGIQRSSIIRQCADQGRRQRRDHAPGD